MSGRMNIRSCFQGPLVSACGWGSNTHMISTHVRVKAKRPIMSCSFGSSCTRCGSFLVAMTLKNALPRVVVGWKERPFIVTAVPPLSLSRSWRRTSDKRLFRGGFEPSPYYSGLLLCAASHSSNLARSGFFSFPKCQACCSQAESMPS